MSTPIQKLILVSIVAYLTYNFIFARANSNNVQTEMFYDWQTQGVNPSEHHDSYEPLGIHCREGCSTPRYIHQPGYPGYHQLNFFQDPKCVGEGSCIYNPESQNDCVIGDWKCTKKCMPKWDDPPLDSDIFDFQKRYGYTPDTSGCLCTKY